MINLFIRQFVFLELSQFTQATTAKEIKYKQQRDELLEGLRFYANEEHWGKDDWEVLSVIHGNDNYNEYGCPGKSARALIAKIEGEK